MASASASIAFQIGLSTGHFRSYEWAITPLYAVSGALFLTWLILTLHNFLEGRKGAQPSGSFPPVMKDSGNATANATGGAGGNASIGDIIIHIPPTQGSAAAPAPTSDRRPKLTFDGWDTKSENMDYWQSGFLVSNHGETALDVRVQRFAIFQGQFASSSAIGNIPAHDRNVLVPVWLEGYAAQNMERWDLPKAMKAAYLAQPATAGEWPEYIVPIFARFEDFDSQMYEITADLRYVHTLNKLVFGPSKQRKIEPYSEVLAFLERTMQRGRAVPYFVEHVAAAIHLPERDVFDALQKLVNEGHAFSRPIEGVGSDGDYTRWGHVYWYAHF